MSFIYFLGDLLLVLALKKVLLDVFKTSGGQVVLMSGLLKRSSNLKTKLV